MFERMDLEIAKLIGQPINTKLPVPVEISAIANTDTANPGDHVYRYSAVDKDADYILDIDPNGVITPIKKNPLSDTPLTFKGLDSRLEYVNVDDVLNSPDTKVLGRKKESITRGMDKAEVKIILDAILADTNVPSNQNVQEYTIPTGTGVDSGDLYDAIMAMKHLVEDYGDGYVLLVGSTVKEEIDLFDKKQAENFNYNVTLKAKLTELDMKVMKIFGKVDRGSGEIALLDAKKMILIATNSRIAEGKPITFVRRIISADIAQLMGADVDQAQRAIIANPTPVQATPDVTGGTRSSLLAYGVYGYESVVMCITNPLAIVRCDATAIV